MFKMKWCASLLILAQGSWCYAEAELVNDSVEQVGAEQIIAAQVEPIKASTSTERLVAVDENVQKADIQSSGAKPVVIAANTITESTAAVTKSTAATGSEVKTDTSKTDSAPTPKKPEKPATKLPRAVSIELDEPVEVKEATLGPEPVVEALPPESAAEEQPAAEPSIDEQEEDMPAGSTLIMLNTEVLPSTTTRLSWSPAESFEMISTPTPVLIAHGAEPGPVLCLTAALHGDELNGIEIVRRVLYNIDPAVLSGTVVGVPIVNLQGFRRGSRYLVDRRDLNRYFPGNPNGSSASRLAHSFFTQVVSHCDALVDLHTGSFYRTNLPQLRADVRNPDVVKLTQGFGATMVLQSAGAIGTLRRAAVQAGIPAVTLEAGESMRLQEKAVAHGVKGIHTLMNQMDMIKSFSLWGDPQPVYYNSVWVRAERGGILFSNVSLGDRVSVGSLLGEVRDPITNTKTEIFSPREGRIIGMAVNQVVQPGFAAFHVGIRAADKFIADPSAGAEPSEADSASELETPVSDTAMPPTLPADRVEVSTDPTTQMTTSPAAAEEMDEENGGGEVLERNLGDIDDREFD
jgi:predicted deacylase